MNTKIPQDDFNKARLNTLRFIKIRPRSIFEVQRYLKKKSFDSSTIGRVVEYCLEKGFLNDEDFARQWIGWRLNRSFGVNRIAMELKLKGIDPGLIRDQLNAALEGFPVEEAALELARKRAARYAGLDPQKKRKRVMDFLNRQGYKPDVINKVIKQL